MDEWMSKWMSEWRQEALCCSSLVLCSQRMNPLDMMRVGESPHKSNRVSDWEVTAANMTHSTFHSVISSSSTSFTFLLFLIILTFHPSSLLHSLPFSFTFISFIYFFSFLSFLRSLCLSVSSSPFSLSSSLLFPSSFLSLLLLLSSSTLFSWLWLF